MSEAQSSIVPALLGLLAERCDLTQEQTRTLFEHIMTGAATPAQIGGALMALRVKGETPAEIAGAVTAMRALSTKVEVDVPYLVDTCGTGGSGSNKLFNVSTAAAFATAAAGAHVAKHGNRGITSRSGSADVLEAAGVNLALTPTQIAHCIREAGVGFMFAPAHHGAIRHAVAPRKELGVRTIFNMIAPLTNPAGAPNQVIGVAIADWGGRLAEVLRLLGSRHVLFVHADGLDELSIAGPSQVVELRQGAITCYEVTPEQFGLTRQPLDALRADSPAASLALMRQALEDSESAAGSIVALNAGAAIYASGVATSFANGVKMALDAIDSGLAGERLAELARVSKLMAEL
jgi:anthranilate phosphoribosyltransferase